MKFFSKETSERLAKIGCVSQSGFCYCKFQKHNGDDWGIFLKEYDVESDTDHCSAFHPWDLCGNEDYCVENSIKLFGKNHRYERQMDNKTWVCDACVNCKQIREVAEYRYCNDYMRHKLIDSKDPEAIVNEAIDRLEKNELKTTKTTKTTKKRRINHEHQRINIRSSQRFAIFV